MNTKLIMLACTASTTIGWIICLRSFFEHKKGKKIGWFLLAILYFVHDFYWGCPGLESTPWADAVECLIVYVMYAVVFHHYFKGRLIQKIGYAFALDFLLQICSMTVEMIAALFFVGFDMEAVIPYLMGVSLHVLIFMVSSLIPGIILTIMLFRFMMNMNKKFVNGIAITLGIVDVLAMIWNNPQCLQLVFPAFLVFLFGNLYMQNRMNKQMREQFAYYSRVDEFEELQREQLGKLRHDMANHLCVAKQLGNDYALQLTENMDQVLLKTTKNKVIDCLLYMKESICKEKKIDFCCQIISLKDMVAKEYDMVSLFANLFDNAIEACERSMGEKNISFSMERKKDYLVISLENSKNPEDTPVKNGFATIKTRKEGHGLGTKVIKEIVEKYDGYIEYEDLKNHMKVKSALCIF